MTTIFRSRIFHKELNVDFKKNYPDYAAIEQHIRRARAERSVAIAHMLAGFIVETWKGLKHLGRFLRGMRAVSLPRKPLPSR